jgi:hypothetical protein
MAAATEGETLPKMVVGSLHLEFKRCGRARCRCRRGFLHGPYVYRRWREDGRQRKAYVPMKRLSEVLLNTLRTNLVLARFSLQDQPFHRPQCKRGRRAGAIGLYTTTLRARRARLDRRARRPAAPRRCSGVEGFCRFEDRNCRRPSRRAGRPKPFRLSPPTHTDPSSAATCSLREREPFLAHW